MTTEPIRQPEDLTAGGPMPTASEDRLLVEDVLLLLFQPGLGTIAGENVLFYVLGGAVVAELALTRKAEVRDGGGWPEALHAVGDVPPSHELLEPAWSYIAQKPRSVASVVAGFGPPLREQVLYRLVERGDLRRTRRRILGLFPSSRLDLGGERRTDLIAQVRAALVDGADPEPRIAALAALLSASGTLPQFHPEIPWGGDVSTRGKEFERGDWGAAAAGEAVTSVTMSVISNAVTAATVQARR